MKDMIKYVFAGIGVVLLLWFFVACYVSFFNGMSKEIGAITGVGSFLAFELVICTGAIISKIKKDK